AIDRVDRAFRGHHGGGANLKDLDDVRLLAGSKGGNRGRHCLGVIAAIDGNDRVIRLAFVEASRNLIESVAKFAAHGMPPVDLHLCMGAASGGGEGEDSCGCQSLSL